ncbi:hypothetical protein [Leifsonia sp. LS-T14]|uniref:hypothetical protein n=1 Tax=unclassified Leifsonia TaxID=2663824 RepID=UPI0035A71372
MDRIDSDTSSHGTQPPFECWEGGQSGLMLVLLDAAGAGLSLGDDADEIAAMVLRSRWFAAATQHRDTEARPVPRGLASSGLAEAFSAGMRVDRVDGCKRNGLVLRVDVTRDPSRIVQVWWRVGSVGSIEWLDPELLTLVGGA